MVRVLGFDSIESSQVQSLRSSPQGSQDEEKQARIHLHHRHIHPGHKLQVKIMQSVRMRIDVLIQKVKVQLGINNYCLKFSYTNHNAMK